MNIQELGKPLGPTKTTVKLRKLKWYGHVTRSSGLAKTIMQGTMQGGRRRGRQKKRWEDNIPVWTAPRGRLRGERNGGSWVPGHLWRTERSTKTTG